MPLAHLRSLAAGGLLGLLARCGTFRELRRSTAGMAPEPMSDEQ